MKFLATPLVSFGAYAPAAMQNFQKISGGNTPDPRFKGTGTAGGREGGREGKGRRGGKDRGKRREEKENGDRQPTIFGVKVALIVISSICCRRHVALLYSIHS